MRRQVLGVEAVLADGRVVGKVPALRKDNTGYDWASILTGSEGTLAVITQVHLGLVRALPERVVALVALDNFAAAARVAGALLRGNGSLLALEVFFADGLRLVCEHTGLPAPFPDPWPVLLLVEAASTAGVEHETARLSSALEDSTAVRASAVATDDAGRSRLWAYRDRHAEAINAAGIPHKLDVALPYERLEEFVVRVRDTVAGVAPEASVVLFGHLGDGNLHVNLLGLEPGDSAADHAVLSLVASMGGSISAEHGIGVAKRADLALSRSAADIDAMSAVKRALDPQAVMNPGVLFPDPDPASRSASSPL